MFKGNLSKKTKKIFVAVTNDFSTDYRVQKTCSYLVDKGFDVFVYGRVLPGTFKTKKPYKVYLKRHWFNNNFWFYAEYNIRLFFYLLFQRYDFILSNDLDTLPACFFVSRLRKVDLIYDSHELFSEGPELQGRKFVQGFWRGLESYFLPKIKKSFTVSQSIVDFYHKKHNNSMVLVRNLPLMKEEIEGGNVNFPTQNKVILYQGVLNPGRGIKPMIEALFFLDNIDLVIIGYGKVEKELKEFVARKKMTGRVHFLGRVERDQLPNYTKKATLGMVLEEPLGKSFEYSLPNKLFDYIHAELPIIAGSLPEIKRVICSFGVGVLVKDYDPKNIALSIKYLLNDKDLMNKIKANQKIAKQELCWEKEQKQLDKFFIN